MKAEIEEAKETWALFDEYKAEVEEHAKEEWPTYRKKGYYAFQDFFLKWGERLRQREADIRNGLKEGDMGVVRFLLQQIQAFQEAWPLLKVCTGEAFETEHWTDLSTLLEKPKVIPLDKLKFGDLLDAIVPSPIMLKKRKAILELSDRAQGEVTVRSAVEELRVWCETTEFDLTEHASNGRQTPLVKEWKEIMSGVSDKQSLILSLKESRYIARFKDQLEGFEKKLGGIDDYLVKLNQIQRKWVYLEPIFMRGALPQEQGRFMRVDEDYRNIALGIADDPKVVSLTNDPNIK
jgi:dynein heavy chain 2